MARYVIGFDVALHLVQRGLQPAASHLLLAPTLLRSQMLSHLYGEVRRGTVMKKDAEQQLDRLRALRIRLLGDRVLQRHAWQLAAELGWPDTWVAEYLALTRLQADAFVTLDADLARAAQRVVPTAPIDALLAGARPLR